MYFFSFIVTPKYIFFVFKFKEHDMGKILYSYFLIIIIFLDNKSGKCKTICSNNLIVLFLMNYMKYCFVHKDELFI